MGVNNDILQDKRSKINKKSSDISEKLYKLLLIANNRNENERRKRIPMRKISDREKERLKNNKPYIKLCDEAFFSEIYFTEICEKIKFKEITHGEYKETYEKYLIFKKDMDIERKALDLTKEQLRSYKEIISIGYL